MISHHVFSAPNPLGCPWLRRSGPKDVALRQPQRQPRRRTQIQASSRNVRLAHGRLMPCKPNRQPALRIECPWPLDHPSHHRRQSTSHLLRRYSLRQFSPQADIAQQLKCSKPIRQRSSNRRKRRLRTDHPLLNRCVSLRPLQRHRLQSTPRLRLRRYCLQHLHQHRLNHKAVVVVPVEMRPIAIGPISHEPQLMHLDCVVHTHRVPPLAHEVKPGFDHRRKQQPVRLPR